jgi:hypothetical protein
MKRFTFVASLLLICTSAYSQAQKNMVKSYPFSNASSILLAVDGSVEIVEWDQKLVRLVTTIDALNFNEATLKALADAGRYSCSYTNSNDGAMILTMLKAQRSLTIRNVLIKEQYQFKIFVPKGVVVEQVNYVDVAAQF